jgi:RNA polymerase sigma factor (TIGR02999 family)
LPPEQSPESVTELLRKWQAGDQDALQALIPLVYRELRRLAHLYLRNERPGHTLQSTALVHEAYMRLVRQGPGQMENRPHFIAISAQLMRQILVEYARSRKAAKRDGGFKLTLDSAIPLLKGENTEVIALDEALKGLARLDPQQSQIVELRFFGGLSVEETSQVLGISTATVKRHWATARAWLHREMSKAVSP